MAIPQALAYAQLAGVPPHYGLYAAFVPSMVGVLFGSSPILSTGPVAMTSLLTAASVGVLVPAGTPQFYAYVTMLALLSGLFQLGFGLARAGVLLTLVSQPVLMGFINAAALIIALSQLPALMGISVRQSQHLLARYVERRRPDPTCCPKCRLRSAWPRSFCSSPSGDSRRGSPAL